MTSTTTTEPGRSETGRTRPRVVRLAWRDRVFALCLTLLFFLLFLVNLLWQGPITVGAPNCKGAPDGCVIEVDRAPDGGIALVLVVAMLVSGLCAATGLLWSFQTEWLRSAPVVEEVARAELAGTRSLAPANDLIAAAAGADPHGAMAVERDRLGALLAAVPAESWAAAQAAWSAQFADVPLLSRLEDVRRKPAADELYLVVSAPDDSGAIVLRVG
jgi:hypothetical protein